MKFKGKRDYLTDTKGVARVQLPPKYYIVRLWAGKKPFVTMFSHWEESELASGTKIPQDYTIRLESAVTAGGRILDEQGKPIAGVKVQVMARGGKPAKADERTRYSTWLATENGDPRLGEKVAATTDAEGRWQIDNVPDNAQTELRLRVFHPDYISDKSWGQLQNEADVTTAMLLDETATLNLRRGIVVSGRVTDPARKPIKNAVVAWGDDPYFEKSGCLHEVRTDAQGIYKMPALPPGPMSVTVMAEGFAPDLKKITIKQEHLKVDFKLEAGKVMCLKFVDNAGKPIPGVHVQIAEWRGGKSLYNIKHPNVLDTKIPEKADKNGIWQWNWAPGDPVKLHIYSYPLKGFAPCDLEIAGGAPPRTITLKPECRITGRVTDAATGKPIPTFTVIPINVFRKNWLSASRFKAKPGKDGRMDYLAERTDIPLRLRVEATGYRTQTGPEFRVGDDGPRTQNFSLQPSEPITGVALDANGRPVKQAKVMLAVPSEDVSIDDRDDFSNNHTALTDADGRFTFPDAGQPFTVVVTADAGFALADFPVDQYNAGTLRLQPWASVRGQFFDGGQPVKGARIFLSLVRLRSLDQPRVDTTNFQIVTDKDGRFEFPRVPPLPVNVRVSLGPWRDEGFRSGPSVPLNLKPGQKVELKLGQPGATVSGKVKLTGKVPADLDCAYSLNYLIRRSPGIDPPPSIAKMGFDIRKGWKSTWGETREGQTYLSTLRRWFVKLAPDGTFRISGVPAGEYDLAIKIYAKPSGCLVDSLARKVVRVTVTEEDAARGKLTLPEIDAVVVPIPMVGDTPELAFQRADGSSGSLADFRGRYTVVHFWASWCGPCKQHLPALRQLQERLAARGLAMLGLSLDDDPAVWQASLKQLDLSWQQGLLVTAAADGISSVPAYWLLDPAGKIVAKVLDPEKLAAEVEKAETKPAKNAEPAKDANSAAKSRSVRISAADQTGKPIPGAKVKIEGGNVTLLASSITLNGKKSAPKSSIKPGFRPMRVRIVDEAGKPLAGAKLRAKYRGGKLNGVTDSEGKSDLALPPPNEGYIYLYATVNGFVPLRRYWHNQEGREPRPAEFTFAFEKGRTIGGVVRNEHGKPIQGVKVRLSISAKKYAQKDIAMMLWDRDFSTDAEGHWNLDHVPEQINSMSIGLEHPDYISVPGLAGISATEQRKIEDRTAVMVMKKGITVSGTVTDPEGKPVADATLRLGEWYSPKRLSVSTDKEGRYSFASLPPGGETLTVTKPGLAPGLRNINVQPAMEPVDFQLEKGNTLRVRVVGKDGKPIPGIFVTPDTWRNQRVLCDLGIRGRTDAEGRWAWTWAPEDAVKINFGLTGRVNYMGIHNLPLAPQETEHVVTIYPSLTISGKVIDAETKQPIPSFRVVRGYMSTGSVEQIVWDRMEVGGGKNGQYKITISRPSRTRLVRIEADGYQPGVSREFKNDEGSVTYDFSLRKGQNLNVRVRLPDDKPAADAEVCLCPEEPGKFINMAMFVKNGRFPYRDHTRPFLKVGADGLLPIEPQDNKFLLIVLHDQGYAQTTSEELAANPQITLKAWARLEGVIRHGTKPVPGAKLDVYPLEGYNPRWSFLNFQVNTDADAEGKFVFAKLKPGKWRVRELPADKRPVVGPRPCEKTVELAPGQTLSVTLGGEGRPVIGRVQWPGGKPPQGDLSRIGADVRPKRPEPPSPPKATRDQGPDAVRAWLKEWRESEEGKAWLAKARKESGCPRGASVDRDGTLRIEGVVPGLYELSVYVQVKEEILPWERPQLLCYEGEFSMPKIPGGVSDEPLDLGNTHCNKRQA